MINSVDKTENFRVLLPHRSSNTVSIETTPLFIGFLSESTVQLISGYPPRGKRPFSTSEQRFLTVRTIFLRIFGNFRKFLENLDISIA